MTERPLELEWNPPDAGELRSGRSFAILATVFVVAVCGLVYELIAGALSSYLLGDSVTQFSLVIGIFLTSMGIGSWLSRFVRRGVAAALVLAELAVGVIGGTTAFVGFAAFAWTESYALFLFGWIVTVGTLVGLEIPLVLRLLREARSLRVTVANVFTLDYGGALLASIAFPFLLLPWFGLVRAGFLVGAMNVAVAGVLLFALRAEVGALFRPLLAGGAIALVLLSGGFVSSGAWVSTIESQIYQDEIVYAVDTPYQRVVITRWRNDTRLFLDGHLQFSSVDEYRYHESLAHPALAAAVERRRVLILGGGDGLLAREVLRYPEVESVDLVDLDETVISLFRDRPALAELNDGSLRDPRVRVHAADALRFLESAETHYDVILIDLPDPNRDGLAKLYSRTFYRLCLRHLSPGGTLATQATSPFRAREAFWCIANTIDATTLDRPGATPRRLHANPYHATVPTFGTWGFVLASDHSIDPGAIPGPERVHPTPRFLTRDLLPSLFVFPADMGPLSTEINDLVDPVLSRYYRAGYHRYLE